MLNFWLQLASISYATQYLFLGNKTDVEGELIDNRVVQGQPSFLDMNTSNDLEGGTGKSASSLAVTCEPLASCVHDLRVLASTCESLGLAMRLQVGYSVNIFLRSLIPLFVLLFRPGSFRQEWSKKFELHPSRRMCPSIRHID